MPRPRLYIKTPLPAARIHEDIQLIVHRHTLGLMRSKYQDDLIFVQILKQKASKTKLP